MPIYRLQPIGKDYLWGGVKLKALYGKDLPQVPLAETWEFAAHPDGASVLANGAWQGQDLRAVFAAHPEAFGPRCQGLTEVPLMVKFIDAQQKLSIQVHPDDAYAAQHEHQRGKSEMWYILQAEPGAQLIYGFNQLMTPALIQQAVAAGNLEDYLRRVPVKAGEVYYIPAGTVHGIGAGITLLEVQENSNVTYRFYDYQRRDKNGQLRPLHLPQALAVVNYQPGVPTVVPPPKQQLRGDNVWEQLCACPYFTVEKVTVATAYQWPLRANNFTLLVCLAGSAQIQVGADRLTTRVGESYWLPHTDCDCRLSGACVMLIIRY